MSASNRNFTNPQLFERVGMIIALERHVRALDDITDRHWEQLERVIDRLPKRGYGDLPVVELETLVNHRATHRGREGQLNGVEYLQRILKRKRGSEGE